MKQQRVERATIPLAGSAVAGCLAGTMMLAVAALLAAILGADPWVPMKMPASIFFLQRALEPGFDAAPVVVGIMTHLSLSILWALPFAYFSHGLSNGATIAAGAGWGVVAWAVMTYIALPIEGLTRLRADMPFLPTLFVHLVFGTTLAIVLAPYQSAVLGSRHGPSRDLHPAA